MFNGLFSSLFGKSKESNNLNSDVESENNQATDASDTKNIFNEENVRVILLDEDKDWLFVERENPEEEDSFVADKRATTNNLQLVPFKSIFSHLSAVSENDENCMLSANLPSLYPNTMDESWFLTPPSCFSSASIQLEASPLENLLIEHPSMSVYHNIRRRRSLADVNRDELEDLVVLELSHDDDDNKDASNKGKRNKGKNANKKSRPNGNQKSVALVLISKPSSAIGAPKAQEKASAMTRSFFDRNNKTLRNSYKKNLHTINQPSSRTMTRKN